MKGFGKVAGMGLIAICIALVAMSSLGTVFASTLTGPLTVEVPVAELEGVDMYGCLYRGEAGPGGGTMEGPMGGEAAVMVQEIDFLSCPEGQTITSIIDPFGGMLVITTTIHFDSADLWGVLMKASGLTTDSGTLNGVTMEARSLQNKNFYTGEPKEGTDAKKGLGLEQLIDDGAMYNLTSDAYFVSMDKLAYTNMTVDIDIEINI